MATFLGKTINGFLNTFGMHLVKIENLTFHKYWNKQQYLEKSEFKYILSLYDVYKKIANVPGHIVELGVAYGRNTIIFSHLINMSNENDVRKYFGFDTFDGFTEESLKSSKQLSKHSWKGISISEVEKRIKSTIKNKPYRLIKGDINKSIPSFLEENPNFRAAMVYVDCNAYEPAIRALENLRPHLSPGAIICIDEKKQGGETKALIEFCEKHNLRFQKDDHAFSIPAYTQVNS
ncbi:MAG: hypothetical protein CMP59_03905 [Flavobacteriales bacterium]|nr:hypothetical protein [Flavobacteriales bacterium]|tara:strand:- start:427 stop:1128 length:702 start_codon:yes stop_codon:yes gene_type:complete